MAVGAARAAATPVNATKQAIVAKWQTHQLERLAGGDAHYQFNADRSHQCRCSSTARARAF
jgi:hypothetical protein